MTLQDLTVLICDDSMFARKKLNMSIAAMGVGKIFEAADGAEAIEKFDECSPDVVFMDIIMPKVTGIDALKAIIAKHPDAKIVMASSVGTQGHLKDALKAGAADFLQKPITDEDAKKILELAAVSFDYKNKALGTDKRGFIAEDVQKILPNLVTPETEEKTASLDYIGMIPYLQAVLKEQEQHIKELEEKLKTKGD